MLRTLKSEHDGTLWGVRRRRRGRGRRVGEDGGEARDREERAKGNVFSERD